MTWVWNGVGERRENFFCLVGWLVCCLFVRGVGIYRSEVVEEVVHLRWIWRERFQLWLERGGLFRVCLRVVSFSPEWSISRVLVCKTLETCLRGMSFVGSLWLKCSLLQDLATWQPSEANRGCARGDDIPSDRIHGQRQPCRVPQISWTQRHHQKGPDKLCNVSIISDAAAAVVLWGFEPGTSFSGPPVQWLTHLSDRFFCRDRIWSIWSSRGHSWEERNVQKCIWALPVACFFVCCCWVVVVDLCVCGCFWGVTDLHQNIFWSLMSDSPLDFILLSSCYLENV